MNATIDHLPMFDALEPRLLLSSHLAPDVMALASDISLRANEVASVSARWDAASPDLRQVVAPATGYLVLAMRSEGSAIDPYLEVFLPSGVKVASNDNASRTSHDSQVRLRVREGQTFYVAASGSNGIAGEYVLSAASVPTDDMPNSLGSAKLVSLSRNGRAQVLGTINYPGDVDVVKFVAPVTGTMNLAFSSKTGQPASMEVFRADQSSLATQTYSTALLANTVCIDVMAGQTYYVRIGMPGVSPDTYKLAMTTFNAEAVASYISPRANEVVSVSARWNAASPDLRQVVAPATGYLILAMRSDGSGIDPYLEVFLPSGAKVASNDNASRTSHDSQVRLRVREGQTFYVAASGSNGTAGEYVLSAASLPTDDMSNSLELAKPVTLSRAGRAQVLGTINYPEDVDVVKFVAPVTGTESLALSSRTGKPASIGVFGADQSSLATQTYSTALLANTVRIHVEAGQTYYVQIGMPGISPDTYKLAMTSSADLPPPTLEPVADQTGQEGALVSFQVNGLPQNGEKLALSAADLPTGASFDVSTGVFSWTPSYSQAGSYHVVFSVSDGLKSSSQTALITIGDVNPAPLSPDPAKVVGRDIFYNNSVWDGSDPTANTGDDAAIATDKQALLPGQSPTTANFTSYSRGINGIMVDIAGLADPAGLNAGDFTFRVGGSGGLSSWTTAPSPASVTIRQGAGVGGSDRVTITWADGAVAACWLQVTVLAAGTGLPNDDVFYFGNLPGDATGNGTTDLADYLLVKESFGAVGGPTQFPADIDRDGSVGRGDLQCLGANLNRQLQTAWLVLGAIGNKTVDEGQRLQFVVSATDPNDNPLTYSASGLPSGATINASTGEFSWTPSYSQAGSYDLTFGVSDGSLSASSAITIAVANVDLPPTLTSVKTLAGARADQSFSITYSALAAAADEADPDGQTLAFRIESVLGGTLTKNGQPVTPGSTLLEPGQSLTWQPPTGQTGVLNAFTVRAWDGQYASVAAVTVRTEVVVVAPPVLDAIGHRIVRPGEALKFTIHATDPNGAPITYSAQNLPAGATFDPTTATFAWTPAPAQTGPVPGIRFIASNDAAACYEDITITPNLNPLGIGATNAYYIDKDMDGYGVGSPLGPDADDSDPTVNTPPSMLAKYGTLSAFLDHIGYGSSRTLFIAPDGNDNTGTVGDISSPYATWAKVRTLLQPGDTVIYRSGTYHEEISMQWPSLNGADGSRITVMAYPGETPTIVAVYGARLMESSHIVIDGLVFNGTELGQWVASWGLSGGFLTDVTLKNLEVRNHYTGMLFMQGLDGLTIDGCVIHDNYAEHGIYLGARDVPNTNITIRGNIIYHNTRNGIQHNGRVTNMVIEGNIIHSNVMAGISLLEGMSYSVIRDNVIFNNDKQGIVVDDYDEGGGINPYDQTRNLIENNMIWVGRYSWDGSGNGPADHAAIVFSNDSAGMAGSLDSNVIRNNILVTCNGPVLWFVQQDYADTTIVENNLFYRANGDSAVMAYGADTYNMASFNAFSSLFQGNTFAEPSFRDVSVNYNAAPERFNFDLLPA